MTFDDEGFEEVARGPGVLYATLMGHHDEMPYDAVHYVNAEGTIGYVDMRGEEREGYFLLSRTASGDVVTMPGDDTEDLPRPPRRMRVRYVRDGSDLRTYYAEHLRNLRREEPIADREALATALDELPQRSADVAMAALGDVVSGFAENLGDLMQNLGAVLGGGGSKADFEATMNEFAHAMEEAFSPQEGDGWWEEDDTGQGKETTDAGDRDGHTVEGTCVREGDDPTRLADEEEEDPTLLAEEDNPTELESPGGSPVEVGEGKPDQPTHVDGDHDGSNEDTVHEGDGPAIASRGPVCPSCGDHLDPDAEWCLTCGLTFD